MALLEVENLQTHFRTPDGINRAVDGVSFQVDEHPRIAIFTRTEGIPQNPGALIPQIILAAVECRVPLTPLQQHDAQPGRRQFFGDDAAAGTRPYHHRVDVLQPH